VAVTAASKGAAYPVPAVKDEISVSDLYLGLRDQVLSDKQQVTVIAQVLHIKMRSTDDQFIRCASNAQSSVLVIE
jgi:hypothetical protein